MKYFIITHGCQMNEHDSERIAYLLEESGYTKADSKDDADFVLYNTCLIRENAELKVYGQIGAMKKWKEKDPTRILAVSGCMMQTGPAREVLTKKYPQVDIIFGTKNIGKLPQLLDHYKNTGKRVIDITAYEDDNQLIYDRMSNHFAYINIMTGCNNFCTYCIVPYARGREESRNPEDILHEARGLARRGYKEIMLLGQNVNSYGKDINYSFPNLLRAIHEIDGIERIRFMSSHPRDLSDDLIKAMSECPNIERHFHLPLQSGSDKVLKEMNRHYTKEKYLRIADKLREAIPGISISTDIIVGFPGETEEDHLETIDVCKKVEYESAFTFIYSPRPGTPAARRDDQVDEKTSGRRFQELVDTLYPIFLKKNREDVGKTTMVLIDSYSKNNKSMMAGRNSENKLIHVPGDESMIGKIVKVKITDCSSFALEGIPVV